MKYNEINNKNRGGFQAYPAFTHSKLSIHCQMHLMFVFGQNLGYIRTLKAGHRLSKIQAPDNDLMQATFTFSKIL